MFPLRNSEKVFGVRARVRRKGVHRVEMTRWYAEKPTGLTGISAPACPLGVSVESRVAGFGHGRVRVQDANGGPPVGTTLLQIRANDKDFPLTTDARNALTYEQGGVFHSQRPLRNVAWMPSSSKRQLHTRHSELPSRSPHISNGSSSAAAIGGKRNSSPPPRYRSRCSANARAAGEGRRGPPRPDGAPRGAGQDDPGQRPQGGARPGERGTAEPGGG